MKALKRLAEICIPGKPEAFRGDVHITGTGHTVVMALLLFPFVIGFARPAVFHTGNIFVPEAVRVYLLAVFVKEQPAVLMDEPENGFLGLFIVLRAWGEEKLPTTRALPDMDFLVDSLTGLFDFIGKAPVFQRRMQPYVPVDGIHDILVLFLEQTLQLFLLLCSRNPSHIDVCSHIARLL